MNAHESPTLGDVFELLNCWRHLPAYSLERCVTPFFAIFLRDVLGAKFCNEMHETVIPEFPLQIHTLYDEGERGHCPNAEPGHSKKVDYVAFDKDTRTAYLVELKTDMKSRSVKQDDYLNVARGKGFPALIEGVTKLAKRPKSDPKYKHLCHRLAELEFISVSEELKNKKQFHRRFVACGWAGGQRCLKTKVVFIQPCEDTSNNSSDKLSDKEKSEKYGFDFIYFEEVAEIVQQQGDLGCMFAHYLRKWTVAAGS